eukprot:Phypoly_transcript_11341.p1 GENE.Phypoly_transcript_11341~~Phypoly_transcript_11341.p1  ORF type:complete len:325 (-),score=32.41 Phypoly_transcript_11341:148-1122(-)
MKAVVIKNFGGTDQLEERVLPIPDVKPNFVRIKLRATSFNPVDWKLRKGYFGGELPLILGNDSAGIIDEIGEGVKDFAKGDEVYVFVFGFLKSNGGYAEYVSLPQQYVALKPKSLTFEEAAAIPIAGLTAYELVVKKAKIIKGQPVFVAGASGGVGSFVVQLLRNLGAFPIVTTAGSESSANYIYMQLGIPKEHIVRYDNKSEDEIAETLLSLTSDRAGFSHAFDLVGGASKMLCFRVLAMEGHVLTIVEEENANFLTPLYPSQSTHSLFSCNGVFSAVLRLGTYGTYGFPLLCVHWNSWIYGPACRGLASLPGRSARAGKVDR